MAVATRRLVITGSGTGLAAASFLAEAFAEDCPEIAVDIRGGLGASAAVRAVADGLIGMAVATRRLRDAEKAQGVTAVPFARTVIVLGAHARVADDGITAGELLQIYQGTKTRWRDGQEIVLLGREPGHCFVEVLEQRIPGLREARQAGQAARRWTVLYTAQEMNRALTMTPQGVGITDLGLLRAQRMPIKTLKFNEVRPSAENAQSGRYPFATPLTLIFRKDRLTPEGLAFLGFATSREGERVLGQHSYLPEA